MNWETFKRGETTPPNPPQRPLGWAEPNPRGTPLVIAHRGYTRGHPPNSLESVQAALDLGVDGVEVDLRMTRDGEIVVFHDREPESMTLKEVRNRWPSAPTLRELLDLVRGRFLMNLEIKNTRLFTARMERAVLEILVGYPQETILFSSFNPPTLVRLRRLAPQFLRGQLFTHRQRLFAPLATPFIQPFSLNLPIASLTPARVAAARAVGRKVFVWTVNTKSDMRLCLDLRVDGLITDEPERLRGLLFNGSHRT